jgi:acyl-coenzyme A thioesterase PaaI-like protein
MSADYSSVSQTPQAQSPKSQSSKSHKQGGFRKFKIGPKLLRFLLNIYGPYVGAAVKIKEVSADFRYVRVEMPLRWYNANYFRTHFGGSLYAMTDPMYVFMLINNLGDDYIVWDKAASINFRAPGKGRVWCEFRLSAEQIAEVKAAADAHGKTEPRYTVEVFDEDGKLVASVEKTLYVRRIVRGA